MSEEYEMEQLNGKNLHYEVEDKYIPEILIQDWHMELDEKEEEFAIEVFYWRYGEHDENDNSDLIEWNLKKDKSYQWGFGHGKISFSLNKDEFNIMAAMIKLGIAIAKHSVNDDGGAMINVGELLSSVIRIRILSDYERCVFYQIIVLTNNSKSVPLKREEIISSYNNADFNDNNCPYKNQFSCNRFHENACLRKKEDIDKIIDSLIEKKVIYGEDKGNGYIHLA